MKAERISVNGATRLSEAVTKLTAMFREHKYVVVSLRPGKDRTLDQNALWFALYQRSAEMTQIGDVDEDLPRLGQEQLGNGGPQDEQVVGQGRLVQRRGPNRWLSWFDDRHPSSCGAESPERRRRVEDVAPMCRRPRPFLCIWMTKQRGHPAPACEP